MTQVLYIFQGVPGSGKSWLAARIAACRSDHIVCCTDDLCMVDGEYRFDPALAKARHANNQERARGFMRSGHTVLVPNTNIRRWECKPYVRFAVELGIPVVFVRVTGNWPNIHGVPLERVEQMRAAMEDLTVESVMASETPMFTK